MDLSDRKKQILKTVVDAYIASGEPVSSKFLTDKLGFSVSSATIRNEMSDLEQMGYLEHLHTSSGRVPTNEGYREYVVNLMERYKLTLDEILLMNSLVKDKIGQFKDVFSETTRLLSELTNYTAVSVSKKPKEGSIRRFECVWVDQLSFLLVMVTSDSQVRTRHIHTEFEISEAAVKSIGAVLNRGLAGVSIGDVSLGVIMKMESELGAYRDLVSPVLRIVYEVVSEVSEYELNVDGISHLLSYPEFSDALRAQELVKLIEEKQELIERMTFASDSDLNVYIGSDGNRLDSVSFLVRPFTLENGVTGAMGLIGPKRMNYSHAIARLDYITSNLISKQIPDRTDERSDVHTNERRQEQREPDGTDAADGADGSG